MNENLNLVEILKDCPKGTKLYSTVFGEVKFMGIKENATYPIIVKVNDENFESFTADGRMIVYFDGECTLFPSRTQRNWAEFKPKKPKFDPKTLKPFDKILGRGDTKSPWQYQRTWCCATFSHINNDVMYPIKTTGDSYKYAVPYNDDTKHLVGTTEEAPEFYRYWED